MTRQEFLDELRIALQGSINQNQVNEHLRYYENYIMEEARKGKSERQVIEELGNPRLIAKTLINTADSGENRNKNFSEERRNEGYGNTSRRRGNGGDRGTSGESGNREFRDSADGRASRGFQADYSPESGWNIHYGKLKLNSWYGKLLLIVVVVLIIVVIGRLVAFLLPIVIPIIIILLVLSLILGNRK